MGNQEKSRKFYLINTTLEIILFTLAALVLNIFLGKAMFKSAIATAIIAIILEIILKVKGINPLLKKAKKVETLYENLQKDGVNNIYFMYDRNSKKERNEKTQIAISKASYMYLLAETGRSYIDASTDRHWKEVKKQLDKSTSFKVLLIHPECENKIVRNKLNNSTGVDRKLNFEELKVLVSKYETLEIRFTDQVYNTLFFTNDYMIYDPYHLGKTSERLENNFVAIEFDNASSNYKTMKSHFDYCWNNSKSIADVEADLEVFN
ncbi:hypothetical protein CN300_26290 [Bacillus thuringiensis]|uniref:hypothetical protein n=1 Tax=Bacillus cereus group TaxID=86661 RepID=UPI000BFA2F3C|nr:hypothetical protein [Bacillus thuringiensis]PFC40645.1 hypothetical protein CN300_26290 [Bacillus thuringiensis]